MINHLIVIPLGYAERSSGDIVVFEVHRFDNGIEVDTQYWFTDFESTPHTNAEQFHMQFPDAMVSMQIELWLPLLSTTPLPLLRLPKLIDNS